MGLHVIVIEDHSGICKGYEDQFKRYGCTVETFSGADETIARLIDTDRPSYDLVFTDINLKSGFSNNKGGVLIARFAKEQNQNTTVVGCSGYFEDSDLDDDDKSHFDGWYSKGTSNWQSILDESINIAKDRKQQRMKQVANLAFSSRKTTSSISETKGEIIVPVLESDFRAAGFETIVITPESTNGFLKPFALWEKNDEAHGEYQLEVMGCPMLMGWGKNRDEAWEALFELIYSYQELLDEPDSKFSASMLKAIMFIRRILPRPELT